MMVIFEGTYVGTIGMLMRAAPCHKCGEEAMYGLFPPNGGEVRLATCANCCHTGPGYFMGLLDGAQAVLQMTRQEVEMYRTQEQRTYAGTGGEYTHAEQTGEAVDTDAPRP